jgi:hypothetical protein
VIVREPNDRYSGQDRVQADTPNCLFVVIPSWCGWIYSQTDARVSSSFAYRRKRGVGGKVAKRCARREWTGLIACRSCGSECNVGWSRIGRPRESV